MGGLRRELMWAVFRWIARHDLGEAEREIGRLRIAEHYRNKRLMDKALMKGSD